MKHHPSLDTRLTLSDTELLKELLFILRVKGDVDGIAQRAIQEFGNISAVLRQSPNDLQKIEGITPTTIKRLKTIYSLFREIIKPNSYPAKESQTFEDLSYFMLTAPQFDGESIRLLFLDENHAILKDFIYKKGSGNQVKVYFREIAKEVLSVGISNLVFIHHKMGSSPEPSPKDREWFVEFSTGFKKLDIKVVDYLIITQDAVFSFYSKKVFPTKTEPHQSNNLI